MTNDMTKGSPIKLILSFMVPLLIGNIFQQFYNMADTIIVGRTISVEALAAVGAPGSISFLIVGFVQGVTSGFAVITAQRFGAGSENGVRPVSYTHLDVYKRQVQVTTHAVLSEVLFRLVLQRVLILYLHRI